MSGNWEPVTFCLPPYKYGKKHDDKTETSCFPRVFKEATDRVNLRDLIRQLNPDEVAIATTYIEHLLKTRPIKQESAK